jgi:hypothetical protein
MKAGCSMNLIFWRRATKKRLGSFHGSVFSRGFIVTTWLRMRAVRIWNETECSHRL